MLSKVLRPMITGWPMVRSRKCFSSEGSFHGSSLSRPITPFLAMANNRERPRAHAPDRVFKGKSRRAKALDMPMICGKGGVVVPNGMMRATVAMNAASALACRSSSSSEACGVVVQNHFEGVLDVFSTAFMAKALRFSQISFEG